MFPNLDGSNVSLVVAFIAGLTTFFASCLLPLVPTYLAYLSGVALSESAKQKSRWRIVKVALFFVIGFVTAFLVVGLSLQRLAAQLAFYRVWINRLGGLVFMVLALFLSGIFKSTLLMKEARFTLPKLENYQMLHAFFAGIFFGFGWTPCIGPVLAVILFWAASQAQALQGFLLLLTYGIGLGVPFIAVALGFETFIPVVKKHHRITQTITSVSALIIFLAGILMFTGQFQRLSLYLLQFTGLSASSL